MIENPPKKNSQNESTGQNLAFCPALSLLIKLGTQ